jgi:hypothetical protein
MSNLPTANCWLRYALRSDKKKVIVQSWPNRSKHYTVDSLYNVIEGTEKKKRYKESYVISRVKIKRLR